MIFSLTIAPAAGWADDAANRETADACPVPPATDGVPEPAPEADLIPPMSMFTTPLPPTTNMPVFMMEYTAMDPLDVYTTGLATVSGWWIRDLGMPFQFMMNEHYGQGANGEPVFGQFLVAPPEDGRYWFCTVATDLAGNVEPLPSFDYNGEPGDPSLASLPGPSVSVWDASTIIDRTRPSSSVTGGAPGVVNSAGPYELTLAFDDSSAQTSNTSGVLSVDLYAWTPSSGGWVYANATEMAAGSDGKFAPCQLASGDGWYHFASVAIDNAGNAEALPTAISDADLSVRLNSNSYSVPVALGWNLVSLPCATSGMATIVLDDSGGDGATAWTAALAYDAPSASWLLHDSSAPSFVNTLGTVDDAMGVWVKVTSLGDGLLTVSGTRPASTNVQLKKGWNLVGYPSWNPSLTLAVALTGVPYDAVQAYSPTMPYNLRNVPGSEAMSPGSGYWIHVTSDCVWTVAG